MNYKRGASGEWIMFISIDSFYRNKTSVAHVLNGFWRNGKISYLILQVWGVYF